MLTRRSVHPLVRAVAAALLIAAGAGSAAAQTVQWRADYNSARKEAADKGRPILLDFGTENCFWCKKLDAGPFRDPVIVSALNERWVTLKVDAERELALASALHIQSYPTVVLAAADGNILGVIEGFVESPRLLEQLQKATGSLASPEWMVRDFQEAAKAVAASDYSRGIALLQSITRDGQERSVQVKARQVLHDLEQQAADRLARAKLMEDRGQGVEAVDTLTELLKSYAGTQAAADAAGVLNTLAARPELRNLQRTRRARELLAQARDDYRTQQYLGCLERCEVLAAGYADLPEGSEALHMATEIKENTVYLSKACDSLNQKMGAMYLALAESWMKKGDLRQAQACLEKVSVLAPGTPPAEMALVKLGQMQGRQTQQTDFKK